MTRITAGVILALAAASQARSAEVAQVRHALGLGAVNSAIIEYDARGLINKRVTGGDDAKHAWRARFVYERPGKYRFDRRTSFRAGESLQVALDDGTSVHQWAVMGGEEVATRVPDALLAGVRRRLQRDAMIHLVVFFLADADFFDYEPQRPGVMRLKARLGDTGELTLREGGMAELRHMKPRALSIRPDGAPGAAPGEMEVRVTAADVRATAYGRLPHRIRMDHDQGWEEWTVRRIAVNVPIPASEFHPPR